MQNKEHCDSYIRQDGWYELVGNTKEEWIATNKPQEINQ